MEKPGYQTTEFWLAVTAQLVPILVLIGVLSQEQAADLLKSTETLIAVAGVFIAALWPIVEYIKGRAKVKEAAQKPLKVK